MEVYAVGERSHLVVVCARYMEPVLGRFISEDPSKDGGELVCVLWG
jgi:hypothetical protein